MRRLKFLRAVYAMPLLLLALWPVPVNCIQCGDQIMVESVAARIVSSWEDNFFCSFECANQWLDEHPLYDENGNIIRRTKQ